MSDRAERAVTFDGRIIGYVSEEWPQTGPGAWTQQWVVWDEDPPLGFDTYESACAHLVQRYVKEQEPAIVGRYESSAVLPEPAVELGPLPPRWIPEGEA